MGLLKVQNLKRYFGGIKAVNNCSFEVKKGTITALIGPNGSGKSTVFNIISGILKAKEGKIIFDKRDITKFTPEKIANLDGFGISRMFQRSRLFGNLTVKNNLLLAMEQGKDTKFKAIFKSDKASKEQEKKLKKILEIVEMERFTNKLAMDLSFGQKRLIELARAILNPNKLLMLDEPVAGVNPKLRKKIKTILRKLIKKENATILLIEHDMDFTLDIADRVIVLDEGKVIAEGPPSKIRNNKRVLEAYLGE